ACREPVQRAALAAGAHRHRDRLRALPARRLVAEARPGVRRHSDRRARECGAAHLAHPGRALRRRAQGDRLAPRRLGLRAVRRRTRRPVRGAPAAHAAGTPRRRRREGGMRLWITTVVLLAATAVYVQLHPPVDLAIGRGALARCPAAFGAWNGTDLSFEDAVVEELKADDLLIRRYRRGDDLLWLCMVYHQNRRLGAHDPRVCYQSQGYLVDPGSRVTLVAGSEALTANRFVVERRDDRRVVCYW